MKYKEECLELRKKVENLEIQLKCEKQVVSILYNVIKDVIFWNKQ